MGKFKDKNKKKQNRDRPNALLTNEEVQMEEEQEHPSVEKQFPVIANV